MKKYNENAIPEREREREREREKFIGSISAS